MKLSLQRHRTQLRVDKGERAMVVASSEADDPAKPIDAEDAAIPSDVRDIVTAARNRWLRNLEIYDVILHADGQRLTVSETAPVKPQGTVW